MNNNFEKVFLKIAPFLLIFTPLIWSMFLGDKTAPTFKALYIPSVCTTVLGILLMWRIIENKKH